MATESALLVSSTHCGAGWLGGMCNPRVYTQHQNGANQLIVDPGFWDLTSNMHTIVTLSLFSLVIYSMLGMEAMLTSFHTLGISYFLWVNLFVEPHTDPKGHGGCWAC